MSDTYQICEKCRCRFAVGNIPATVCDMCEEKARKDEYAKSLLRKADAEITRLHAEVERLRTQLDKIEALDDHPSLSGNERTRLVRRIEDKKPELAVEMVWEYATEKCAEWAIAMAATPPAQHQEKPRED